MTTEQEELGDYALKIRCAPLKKTIHEETMEGATYLAAERRLGDLWNEHGSHQPGRGIRATLKLGKQLKFSIS